MFTHFRPNRNVAETALHEEVRRLTVELSERQRILRRIRTATIAAGALIVIAAFATGTLLRDSHPTLAAAADALAGGFYLLGAFTAVADAPEHRRERRQQQDRPRIPFYYSR
jgi:hypothetical protein